MLKGKQTWIFESKPYIIGSSSVVGPFEGKGPLASEFDIIHDDIWINQETFEKAEKLILEEACEKALEKSKVKKEDINFFISGDLMNQIISSSFAARTLEIPFIGIFGACSSAMEALAISAQLVDSRMADFTLAAASSHNATVEKQFRYPTEYGGQKPPTSQWTVTGAGAAVVASSGEGPRITSATIGRVVDMGITDPYSMGSAMAPAAVDTMKAHFKDLGIKPSDYDLIATGDLGKIGHVITKDLLAESDIDMSKTDFTDCGMLIYSEAQEVFAGGSGCGCSAVVTYSHLINRLKKRELNKILIIGTGALLSPLSYQQSESIPCIAHAVSIEM
jgi:stage V sporulation protein AD